MASAAQAHENILNGLQAAIESAAQNVGPAVVGLGRGWGVGSGVVVGQGQVLTNAHNLRGDEVTVTFADGRRETGEVAGVDVDGDVALISVDTGDVAPVEWAQDPNVAIGTPIVALGNPGGRGLRVTLGFVSSIERSFRGPRGRRVRGSVEHTAPLPRGSSGGPLVDQTGRLLGLNTLRLEGGLILALPADAALRERVTALARGESPARPRLGLAVAPAHVARRLRRAVGLPEREGVLVRSVAEGGPADVAGIERGDLIVAVGGDDVTGIDAVHDALDALAPGATLELTLLRGTEERNVTISFDSTPASA